MPFTPTTWVNGGAPGISEAELNRIEAGIDDIWTAFDADTSTFASTITVPGVQSVDASLLLDATSTGASARDLYLRADDSGGTLRTRVLVDGDGDVIVYDNTGTLRARISATTFTVDGELTVYDDSYQIKAFDPDGTDPLDFAWLNAVSGVGAAASYVDLGWYENTVGLSTSMRLYGNGNVHIGGDLYFGIGSDDRIVWNPSAGQGEWSFYYNGFQGFRFLRSTGGGGDDEWRIYFGDSDSYLAYDVSAGRFWFLENGTTNFRSEADGDFSVRGDRLYVGAIQSGGYLRFDGTYWHIHNGTTDLATFGTDINFASVSTFFNGVVEFNTHTDWDYTPTVDSSGPTMRLDNTAPHRVEIGAGFSSEKHKRGVADVDVELSIFNDLRGVWFHYSPRAKIRKYFSEKSWAWESGRHRMSVLAEELEAVRPEWVHTHGPKDFFPGEKTINWEGLIPDWFGDYLGIRADYMANREVLSELVARVEALEAAA